MMTPEQKTSPRRLVAFFGVYLLARLGVHPETTSLAALWQRIMDMLKAALGVSEAASERRVVARATLDFADLTLDNAVRAVAAAAKADLGGRAGGPDWDRLFPVLPGEAVRLPIAKEIDMVKRMESELASGAAWAGARAQLPALTAKRQALEGAYADYRAAIVASDISDHGLAVAKEEWRNSYRSVFGGLTERFPADKALVESFFWRETEARPSEAPAPQPTPPQPTA